MPIQTSNVFGSVLAEVDDSSAKRKAIIIGAGPAGLTAALELLERTDIIPIVLEQSEYMGGISRTVNYKGNRIDIGGHRFFSKSDRVMQWWQRILPVEAAPNADAPLNISYRNQIRGIGRVAGAPDPAHDDAVMLVRERRSRIFYLRKFFEYPIKMGVDTIRKMGILKTARAGFSYVRSALFPIKPERTLEEFFINRFGRELYRTFFKSYTEKIWGVPCGEISAEWGAQRIKGLSIYKSVQHAVRKMFQRSDEGWEQHSTETSLIERFLYPKYGPGQMWEEVARRVREKGGVIQTGWKVQGLEHDGNGRIVGIRAQRTSDNQSRTFQGSYYFSTMPVKDLIASLTPEPPSNVREVAAGLQYRDFLTVGLLCNRLMVHEVAASEKTLIRDNWIYIQEADVQVGRLQIFNNWSPFMVADPSKVWIGLEYFCSVQDALWKQSDEDVKALAMAEMKLLGIVDPADVVDGTVIRMEKTYPAYFGTYGRLREVTQWIDQFTNLFLIGRNGMHKYNNQDHSMLTAMVAVDNIVAGVDARDNLWTLNTEQEYHEEKSALKSV